MKTGTVLKRRSVPHHNLGEYPSHTVRNRKPNTDELVTTPREAPPFKPYKVPRDMLEVFKRIDPNKVNISPNA